MDKSLDNIEKEKMNEREKEFEKERERKMKERNNFPGQDMKFDDLGGFLCFVITYAKNSYIEDEAFRKSYNKLQEDIIKGLARELEEKGMVEVPVKDKIMHFELNKEEKVVNLQVLNQERKILAESQFPIPENLLEKFKEVKEPFTKEEKEDKFIDENNLWNKSDDLENSSEENNPWAEKLQKDKENENSLGNELEIE